MKHILIIVAVLLSLNLYAESRTDVVSFSNLKWSKTESGQEVAVGKQVSQISSLKKEECLSVQLENVDSDYQLVALVCPAQKCFNIYIDGQLLYDVSIKSTIIFIDISSFFRKEAILTLEAEDDISESEIEQWFQYASLNFISGVFVRDMKIEKDNFFGGSMVDVDVQNLSNIDVDGKLYVHVLDTDYNEIAKNNNCAFSRSNSEGVIEVSFPDLAQDLSGKTMLVNVTLVDKENNESIVDELTLPMQF